MAPEEILDHLNENVKITMKNKERPPGWTDGMNYKVELSEVIYPLINKIVIHDLPDHDDTGKTSKGISLKKSLPHPSLVQHYTTKSLSQSIETVLLKANDGDEVKTKTQINYLLQQVRDAIDCINLYNSCLEPSRESHGFCLAIQFYLGHYHDPETQ